MNVEYELKCLLAGKTTEWALWTIDKTDYFEDVRKIMDHLGNFKDVLSSKKTLFFIEI